MFILLWFARSRTVAWSCQLFRSSKRLDPRCFFRVFFFPPNRVLLLPYEIDMSFDSNKRGFFDIRLLFRDRVWCAFRRFKRPAFAAVMTALERQVRKHVCAAIIERQKKRNKFTYLSRYVFCFPGVIKPCELIGCYIRVVRVTIRADSFQFLTRGFHIVSKDRDSGFFFF